MVSLFRLRMSKSWTLEKMSNELGVSIATISRIERRERIQQKQPLDMKMIEPLIASINETFHLSIALEDLEGVTIAPPRPGRPKKAVKESES